MLERYLMIAKIVKKIKVQVQKTSGSRWYVSIS